MKIPDILPILFLVLVLPVLPGCSGGGKSPDSGDSKENVRTVVLVTLDTWRRDATGFLGKSQPSPTPFLDTVASRGLVAADAVAPVPITGPSHWSMLTGRWPWRGGLQINGDKPGHPHGVTLARVLSSEGWRSAGFVSCRVLDHRVGFAEGFAHFDDMVKMDGSLQQVDMPERRGDITVDAVLKWVGQAIQERERLFLWVHLFDPHFPYRPPTGPLKGKSGTRGEYLGEVAFADGEIRRLSAGLGKLGRPIQRSLWVVISDHGEALGEHGEDAHGLLLHGCTTRIPLIVAGPGVPVGRYEKLAATVDVFPTILGYLGIGHPAGDGVDLLAGNEAGERAIPLESMMAARTFGISGAVGVRWKNWLWEASPRDHLWDLAKDPMEQNDVARKFPQRVRFLKKLRKNFGSSRQARGSRPDTKLLGDLQTLGYISGNMKPGTDSVREFVKKGRRWHDQAVTLQQEGRFARADRVYRKFLRYYGRSPITWQKAGIASVQLGDYREAERRFRKSIELDPDEAAPHLNLANVFFVTRRYPEAEKEYKEVLRLDPEDMFALYNLGLLLSNRQRLEEAAPFWEKYLKLYPNHKNAPHVREKLKNIK